MKIKSSKKRSYLRSAISKVSTAFPRVVTSLIVSSILVAGPAVAAATLTGTGDVDSYVFNSSKNQSYEVYVPASYNSSTPASMIMALHGCVMDNHDALNAWNLDKIADQHNVILVFPFVGTFTGMRDENCWGYWLSPMIQEGQNGEVDYIYNVAREVESMYEIDTGRRFITGLSSGGGMAVAESIAYSDYWTAAAPVAGLAYGDWASSILSELFKTVGQHVTAIENELNDSGVVPMLVVQSQNDTTVLPEAMELIRDSQLTVWADDLQQDGATESCSKGGVNCELKTYNGSDGTPIIKTMLYAGGPGREATYGTGHYWTGGDNDLTVWSDDFDGPSAAEQMWEFFDEIAGGGECEVGDNIAPANPTGLYVVEPLGNSVSLSLIANSESDLRGYKIYRQDGSVLRSSPAVTTSISVSGLTTETSYNVYATAVDNCGNESGASNIVNFTTTAEEENNYSYPSETGTVTTHFVAKHLTLEQYLEYGDRYGYIISITIWQLESGTWTDVNPGDECVGNNCDCVGSACDCDESTPGSCPPITIGKWSTDANIAGMEVHTYLPTTTTTNGKRALMISLHGCDSSFNDPNEWVKNNWGWTNEADQYGMVIAAPYVPEGGMQGLQCWDYYGTNHSGANPSRNDDNLIDLANNMIGNVSLNIDPDQVYISGLSSGGSESFVMGCVAPQIFAGIGIAAGPSLGTTANQINPVAPGVSASSVANLCRTYSNNDDLFNTQITSVVHGLGAYAGATSDGLVAIGYAHINADAMANVYGVTEDAQPKPISGGGTETTWSDNDGVRLSKIMVTNLNHAWPAGSGSSGGGTYTNHSTIDYPAFLTKFFFDNNRRAVFAALDADGDGIPDTTDNCPNTYNPDQEDSDGDNIGNLCDATPYGPDTDGDGHPDLQDNCPNVANPDQLDSNGDGRGDACPISETDTDGDGIIDAEDNCPNLANTDQLDWDNDGIGDVCDSTPYGPDADGDTIPDDIDNCPNVSNVDQLDSNGDGVGDACTVIDCDEFTTFNYYHKTAGRATSSGSYWSPNYVANGSNDSMPGSTWGTTTLSSFDGSHWDVGSCPQ